MLKVSVIQINSFTFLICGSNKLYRVASVILMENMCEQVQLKCEWVQLKKQRIWYTGM